MILSADFPQAFCQDSTCSDNEFCGVKSAGGATRCFCRPIFASSYRQRDALGRTDSNVTSGLKSWRRRSHCVFTLQRSGDPTVCIHNTASVTLVNCLLEDKGIDYSVLHLNDPTCRGQMDEDTHLVTFSFNSTSCGTEVKVSSVLWLCADVCDCRLIYSGLCVVMFRPTTARSSTVTPS